LPLVVLAAIIGGASIGGEADLLPYLAGRYFGKGAVSKVFGWFLSAYFLGAAIGPLAFARAMTAFNGPTVPLFALVVLQFAPALLFLTLGPYPDLKGKGVIAMAAPSCPSNSESSDASRERLFVMTAKG
jgi:MFS family permease